MGLYGTQRAMSTQRHFIRLERALYRGPVPRPGRFTNPTASAPSPLPPLVAEALNEFKHCQATLLGRTRPLPKPASG